MFQTTNQSGFTFKNIYILWKIKKMFETTNQKKSPDVSPEILPIKTLIGLIFQPLAPQHADPKAV